MSEAAMVSTPEEFTNIIPITPKPSGYTKKSSARKPLHQFTETLDVTHKTGFCRFCASKANNKEIKKEMCCGRLFQSAVVIKK